MAMFVCLYFHAIHAYMYVYVCKYVGMSFTLVVLVRVAGGWWAVSRGGGTFEARGYTFGKLIYLWHVNN